MVGRLVTGGPGRCDPATRPVGRLAVAALGGVAGNRAGKCEEIQIPEGRIKKRRVSVGLGLHVFGLFVPWL